LIVGAAARRGREEEAVRAELAVERRVDDARLHVGLEVLGTDRDHIRHARDVEHDAAADGDGVPLEARARAARGERDRVLGAELHHRDHVAGRERPDDGVGACTGERGGVAGRGLQVAGAGGAAVGEVIGEGAEEGRVEGHGAGVAIPAREDKGRVMC